ncbi:MAG: RagB/SusD family nutrient uptake outer membrane protein [Bacteroidetes bacterium]|nr:RagB/SusD family nutrient uptake outer membrane protein [Bacteroidota bacterium]
MNRKSFKLSALLLLGFAMFAVSCFKDLDTVPLDKNTITSATVYEDPNAYKQVLAKLYAGLALSGQQGPAGLPDISGIDEGFSTYLRQYWKAQELPTEEAVIAWNDGTIQDFHQQDWDANSEFITAMYNRIFYQISLCNEFIRETTSEKLDSRNVDAALRAEITHFRAEARFLRALSYFHALDLFRSVPFVTENDVVGSFFPRQASASELFSYIESECKAIDADLVNARQNEYGRADKAAAWTLLAKLYLNAKVYVGRELYSDCITYCKKTIDAGYQLEPKYQNLFLADNNKAQGIIFPVLFDGLHGQTYGGTTFMCHAQVGGSMSPADFGLDGGWGGTRVTSALVEKFPAIGGSTVVAPNDGNTSYPLLYVPGSYQSTAWTPSDATTVLASANADGKFEGYLYFPAATQFKFTTGPSWDVNYGDTGADGKLDSGGDNINITDAGFYKINVDINALTYTLKKTDWGLIGSATPDGWNSDQNMSYDPSDRSWNITLNLTAGEVKFRANDDWGLNYGDNGGDALLEEGGANIAIPSNGLYAIKLFLDKPDYTYSISRPAVDSRAMFYTNGQSLEISDISQFKDGYAVTKYKNITSTGQPGSNPTFVDIDFPLFRIEDVYLMYAEAVLRGGTGGSATDALAYVNAIRTRAYNGTAGNIAQSDLTLDFILDERARELYWECHRRTDLVRFGRFTQTNYVWPWKGGVPAGKSTDAYRDIYPIPSSDLGANPNLKQNPNY